MTDQQLSHRDQRDQRQHHHYDQHDQHRYRLQQGRQPSGHPEAQRREFLWRERVKLEVQAQALLARAARLEEEWNTLQQRRATMQHQKPKLAVLIVLVSLIGIRSLPAERRFWYERERLAQQEARLQQARSWCQHDLAALQAQIEVIQQELQSLSTPTSPL